MAAKIAKKRNGYLSIFSTDNLLKSRFHGDECKTHIHVEKMWADAIISVLRMWNKSIDDADPLTGQVNKTSE